MAIGDAKAIANLGFTYADETYMDVMESVLLHPTQFGPRYELPVGRYEIMATVNNLTDEKYYTSADLFDSVVVKPLRAEQFL